MSTDRPRGRRPLRIGIAIMAVAALAIAASVGAWLVFGRTSTEGAELVSMPGSFSIELTEGDWALYSEVVGGSQPVAGTDAVTIEGPGEVTTTTTYGFFSDTTTIDFEGTEYEVFMRLDVPEDGTYDVVIERDDDEAAVVVGQYPDHDVLATVVIVTVIGAILLGTAGFVVTIVGLILWLTGRNKNPPPYQPPYQPPVYPTA